MGRKSGYGERKKKERKSEGACVLGRCVEDGKEQEWAIVAVGLRDEMRGEKRRGKERDELRGGKMMGAGRGWSRPTPDPFVQSEGGPSPALLPPPRCRRS